MKKIEIKRSNLLYRFFEKLYESGYYSFIQRDRNGNINSFNDVCTFTAHFIRVILESLFMLCVAAAIILFTAFILAVTLYTLYKGADSVITQEWSTMAVSWILYPVIFYLSYKSAFKKDGESAMGKFVEIISSKTPDMCVQIDVIDDTKKVDVDGQV